MAGESPAAVLVDGVNGVEIAVEDAVLIPLLTRALLVAGRDGGGIARFLRTDGSGNLNFSLAQPTASVVASVGQTVVSTTLLAANGARLGATVYNHVNAGNLFIKLGAGASTADFSVRLLPGSAFMLPFPAYTGQITGIWSVGGGGSAQVTELT
jgi:hypothetical protein